MKENKYFFITIDTEGDNQWDLNNGISTENSKYLPRFQELAEKYNFKPIWLTNHEMANDDFFVSYMKTKQEKGLCEIGMHLHAWNNPPEFELKKINNERDYLIEYPEEIIRKKVEFLTNELTEKFGIRPISHRSGRWTTNDIYLKILKENGYRVDCSVTPNVSWKKCVGSTGVPGSDYSDCPSEYFYIYDNLIEIPMTIKKIHDFQYDKIKNIKNLLGEFIRLLKGRVQWLRPDFKLNTKGMIDLIKKCYKNSEYIMFMIHSSELMPGGSPNFKTEKDIERLYEVIEKLFKNISDKGYKGCTFRNFIKIKRL